MINPEHVLVIGNEDSRQIPGMPEGKPLSALNNKHKVIVLNTYTGDLPIKKIGRYEMVKSTNLNHTISRVRKESEKFVQATGNDMHILVQGAYHYNSSYARGGVCRGVQIIGDIRKTYLRRDEVAFLVRRCLNGKTDNDRSVLVVCPRDQQTNFDKIKGKHDIGYIYVHTAEEALDILKASGTDTPDVVSVPLHTSAPDLAILNRYAPTIRRGNRFYKGTLYNAFNELQFGLNIQKILEAGLVSYK